MRGALGIVEVESLLSLVERDTATLAGAVSALRWSTVVRVLAVFQVQRQALVARSYGGRHAAREPGHKDAGRLVHAVERVLRQLARVEANGHEVAGRELTAVEHVQHLVALVGMRRPVDDQESADGRSDPQ